jgi:hypothetical protein
VTSEETWNYFLTERNFADTASADYEWIEPLYRQTFPTLTTNGFLEPFPADSPEQKLGFDRGIILGPGDGIRAGAATVDEKIRRYNPVDLYLEIEVHGKDGGFLKETFPRYLLTFRYPQGGTVICADMLKLRKSYFGGEKERWRRWASKKLDGFSFARTENAVGLCIPLHEVRRICGDDAVKIYQPARTTTPEQNMEKAA